MATGAEVAWHEAAVVRVTSQRRVHQRERLGLADADELPEAVVGHNLILGTIGKVDIRNPGENKLTTFLTIKQKNDIYPLLS